MVKEEDEEADALVRGEEEVMIQEGATRVENESGEAFGPEEEQIEIPVPVKRYPNVFKPPPPPPPPPHSPIRL